MIDVAAYIRMSTDEQKDSPERQKALLNEYAQREGRRIVEWYQDHGERGWDETRSDFRRLLEDAKKPMNDRPGAWKHILIDEASRLSRMSEIEHFEHVTIPLHKARVAIEYVDQRRIIRYDGDDIGDLFMGILNQHKASQESITLGRRVASGMARKVKNGEMYLFRPYGYRLIRRNDRLTVEPGDPEEIRVVRFIFDAVVNQDMSTRRIARELNQIGAPLPEKARKWRKQTILRILQDPTYIGCYVPPRTRQGRYYTFKNGETQRIPSDQKNRTEVYRRDELEIQPDHHEPLISKVLFADAQRRIAENRIRTSPARNREEYPLSQLVYCAHCGKLMYGVKERRDGQIVPFYRCQNSMEGSDHTCYAWKVRESTLIGKLAELITRLIDDGTLEELREEIRQQLADHTGKTEDTTEATRRRVEGLNAKIAKASKNILLLDDEEIPAAQKQIREWKQERDALKRQLDRKPPEPTAGIDQLIDAARNLREQLEQAHTASLRALVRAVVKRIEVRCEPKEKKEVTRYPLAGGMLRLQCEDLAPSVRGAGR